MNIWIFGLFERGTKKVYVKRVEKRDARTLFNVVGEHVLAGTTIKRDQWRGYSEIKRCYNVESVNHSFNFVDPNNSETHTIILRDFGDH